MSRSGYDDDDYDDERYEEFRIEVNSSIQGKCGQDFLREMLHALDALPERKLIANDLEKDGCFCAIGAVGRARGIDMSEIDPEDYWDVAVRFGIEMLLAQEIFYMNDEFLRRESPEERFARMRGWIEDNLFDSSPRASDAEPEMTRAITLVKEGLNEPT